MSDHTKNNSEERLSEKRLPETIQEPTQVSVEKNAEEKDHEPQKKEVPKSETPNEPERISSPLLDEPIAKKDIPKPPGEKTPTSNNAHDKIFTDDDLVGLSGDDVDLKQDPPPNTTEATQESEIPQSDDKYDALGEEPEHPEDPDVIDIEIDPDVPFKFSLSDAIATYGFEKGLSWAFYQYAKINDKRAYQIALKYADYDFARYGKDIEKAAAVSQEAFKEIEKRNEEIFKAFQPDSQAKQEVRQALRECLQKWKFDVNVGPEGKLAGALGNYIVKSLFVVQQLKKDSQIFEKKQVASLDRFEQLVQQMEKTDKKQQKKYEKEA